MLASNGKQLMDVCNPIKYPVQIVQNRVLALDFTLWYEANLCR